MPSDQPVEVDEPAVPRVVDQDTELLVRADCREVEERADRIGHPDRVDGDQVALEQIPAAAQPDRRVVVPAGRSSDDLRSRRWRLVESVQPRSASV